LYLAGEFAKELLTERKIKLQATIGALQRERANLATFSKKRQPKPSSRMSTTHRCSGDLLDSRL
jgi:hypothetical protein